MVGLLKRAIWSTLAQPRPQLSLIQIDKLISSTSELLLLGFATRKADLKPRTGVVGEYLDAKWQEAFETDHLKRYFHKTVWFRLILFYCSSYENANRG